MPLALTEFHAVLFPTFAVGCLVGGALSWFAAGREHPLWNVLLLFLAVAVVWFAVIAGVHLGYDAWQAIDDPPEEAFADGANLMGSILVGWLPAGVFCLVVFVVARVVGMRSRSKAGEVVAA